MRDILLYKFTFYETCMSNVVDWYYYANNMSNAMDVLFSIVLLPSYIAYPLFYYECRWRTFWWRSYTFPEISLWIGFSESLMDLIFVVINPYRSALFTIVTRKKYCVKLVCWKEATFTSLRIFHEKVFYFILHDKELSRNIS